LLPQAIACGATTPSGLFASAPGYCLEPLETRHFHSLKRVNPFPF